MTFHMWRVFDGFDLNWRNTWCNTRSSHRRITLQVLRRRRRKRSVRMTETKEKTNPSLVDQEGSLAPRYSRRTTSIKVQFVCIWTRRKHWKESPLLLSRHHLKWASVVTVAWTPTLGCSAENQLWFHTANANGQSSKITIQRMSRLRQELLGAIPKLRSQHLDEFTRQILTMRWSLIVKDNVVQSYDIEAVVLIYIGIWGWKR